VTRKLAIFQHEEDGVGKSALAYSKLLAGTDLAGNRFLLIDIVPRSSAAFKIPFGGLTKDVFAGIIRLLKMLR